MKWINGIAVFVLILSSVALVAGCETMDAEQSSEAPSAAAKPASDSRITPQDLGYVELDRYEMGQTVSMKGTLLRRRDNGAMTLKSDQGKVAIEHKNSPSLAKVDEGEIVVIRGIWAKDSFDRPTIKARSFEQ